MANSKVKEVELVEGKLIMWKCGKCGNIQEDNFSCKKCGALAPDFDEHQVILPKDAPVFTYEVLENVTHPREPFVIKKGKMIKMSSVDPLVKDWVERKVIKKVK